MTKLSAWKKAGVVLMLCAATTIAAPAQTLTTLVNFDDTDGAFPVAAPIQGADGKLYGTTEGGGAHSNNICYSTTCGTVFQIAKPRTLTSLYSFCTQPNCADGGTPYAGLVQANDGNFYGTTIAGGDLQTCVQGCGVVFKISPDGTMTTLHRFCSQTNCSDGGEPDGQLIQGTDGSLYGTTLFGGASGNGTVFRITPSGVLTIMHSFAGRPMEGEEPEAGVIQASDGNFYGTTHQGGTYDSGTVFRMTPGGTLTTLYSFCSQPNCTDGSYPDNGSLVQASDGNFYGTTPNGGTILGCNGDKSACGTVFKITPSGALTTLHSFENLDGAYPYSGMIQGTDGNLYGATFAGGNLACFPFDVGCGTLFRITLDGVLTMLHSFDLADGDGPNGLIQATNGTFYGATGGGGHSCTPNGCGTAFSLDVGLGPFVTFLYSAGKVGQTGPILGQGFNGTTSVSLNGTPASFTVKTDTLIEATIPAGATTGYVTVTTPSGTLTSNVPFHVIP